MKSDALKALARQISSVRPLQCPKPAYLDGVRVV